MKALGVCRGALEGVQRNDGLNIHINLGRLWCPAVWSNTSLDVAMKVFFNQKTE